MPLKLGHIAYTYPDVQGLVKFYCDTLGFRVSDWRGDFFAFLRCSRDHHTVNFLRDDKTAIHHIAFELRDWSDIKRASDLLAKSNIKLTWGPLRHIIGHNIAIYHQSPDGVVIEFFCEIDQMHDEELGFFEPRPWHQDRPQRPKVWGDGTLSNWWGPMSHSRTAPMPRRARLCRRPLCQEPSANPPWRTPECAANRRKAARRGSRNDDIAGGAWLPALHRAPNNSAPGQYQRLPSRLAGLHVILDFVMRTKASVSASGATANV